MQLYLIRHAQSANNSLPESQRVEDPGITDLGHRQTAALARWIAPLHVDVLITSGFRRTLQTSSPLVDALKCEAHVWRDLHEVGGCYRGYLPGQEQGAPGMSNQQIRESFPGFEVDPLIGPEGWWASKPYESQALALARADRMLAKLVDDFGSSEKTIVAVIHADFKVCLLRHLLGDAFTMSSIGPMLNTGISKFTFRDDHARLDILNAITHLHPSDVS